MTTYSFPDIVDLEMPFNPATDVIFFPSGYSASQLVIEEDEAGYVLIAHGSQRVALMGITYAQLQTANFTFFTNPFGGSSAVVFGDNGANTITTASGGDFIEARGGNDTINIASGGFDKVLAGDGDDTINAGNSLTKFDRIQGGAGLDTLNISGSTSITFDAETVRGIEVLRVAVGSNYAMRTNAATAGSGETLAVNASALGAGNFLFFDGAATLGTLAFTGGAGNDQLIGGLGNDSFNAAAGGTDIFTGNSGDDTFCMRTTLDTTDRISGGDGLDTLVLEGVSAGAPFTITATTASGIEAIRFKAGQDFRITMADAVTDTMHAVSVFTIDARALVAGDNLEFNAIAETGTDLKFYDGAGADNFTGGARNDYFDMRYGGIDQVNGRQGDDTFFFGGAYQAGETVIGGAGIDTMVLTAGHTGSLAGVSGVEQIQLGGGSFSLAVADSVTDPGVKTKILATSLTAGQALVFDATLETNGSYRIDSGAGDDTLRGSAGWDLIYGGGGSDTLFGGAGNDILDGGAGDDILQADALDNLYGGLGFDTVSLQHASAGVNFTNVYLIGVERIVGSGFNDQIRLVPVGSTGMTVEGRGGADILTGSNSSDRFVYLAVGDSQAGGAEDTISRFGMFLADKVDLSAIDANTATGGDDAFTFIAGSAFSGTAGELRFQSTVAHEGFLQADVNGDGVADLEINFVSIGPNILVAGDFVF